MQRCPMPRAAEGPGPALSCMEHMGTHSRGSATDELCGGSVCVPRKEQWKNRAQARPGGRRVGAGNAGQPSAMRRCWSRLTLGAGVDYVHLVLYDSVTSSMGSPALGTPCATTLLTAYSGSAPGTRRFHQTLRSAFSARGSSCRWRGCECTPCDLHPGQSGTERCRHCRAGSPGQGHRPKAKGQAAAGTGVTQRRRGTVPETLLCWGPRLLADRWGWGPQVDKMRQRKAWRGPITQINCSTGHFCICFESRVGWGRSRGCHKLMEIHVQGEHGGDQRS